MNSVMYAYIIFIILTTHVAGKPLLEL